MDKKSFKFQGFAYKSKCSYYDSSKTIFNSLSHEHCIRRCIRYDCEVKLNCLCFGINDGIYQKTNHLDYGFDNLEICRNNQQYMGIQTRLFTKSCYNLCSSDCINDEYAVIEKYNNEKFYSYPKYCKFRFYWDESEPFIINEETPVMNFTDYYCYIGGLFGMWFGISANQLFENLRKNYFLYYRLLIHYSIILIYTLFEILLIIKEKFQFIISFYVQKIYISI